jgi:hypothetical protein
MWMVDGFIFFFDRSPRGVDTRTKCIMGSGLLVDIQLYFLTTIMRLVRRTRRNIVDSMLDGILPNIIYVVRNLAQHRISVIY